MCFSSIAGSMINVAAADVQAVFTFADVSAEAGDIVNVDITYSSANQANLIALSAITLSGTDAQIVGFEFSEGAKAVINTGLSNYDPETSSIITLFNAVQTFDGVLGTLEIEINDDAKAGKISISAGSRVLNEGVGEVDSSVETGIITVTKEATPGGDGSGGAASGNYYSIDDVDATPGETVNVDVSFSSDDEVNLIGLGSIALSSDDAEIVGFAFSDEAKAVINTALSNYDPETKSIITLFNQAQAFDGVLGTLQIKVSEDAEEGEIEITATSRVQNEAVGVYESEVLPGSITVIKDIVAEKATYTIESVEANAGETVDVDVSFKTTQPANLISLYSITLSGSDAEIVDFEYSDAAKAVINTGLSNYDPSTKSVVTLFNQPMAFDGVLGTLKIKLNDNAPTGNIAITASSNVMNEGVGNVESEVVAGNIAVTAWIPVTEGAEFVIGNADAVAGDTVDVAINFTTDTDVNLIAMSEIAFDSANAEIAGFEFSDAAKAVINTALSNYDPQTKSIIVLFNEAGIFDGVLGTLKVKVADAAPTGEIAVTAGSRVQNEAVGLVESTVTGGKISVTEKAVELEGAEFVIGNAEAIAGETVDVAINYTTDTPANLVAISAITFDSGKAEIVEFNFSDEAKAVINTGLSNYDPETKSIVILFNEAMIFDGVLGTMKVKIANDAPDRDITMTAVSVAKNEGVGDVASKVKDGKISVTAKAPVIPEISGIEVTANAVEIADADKADEAKIIEAVKTAITKIAVKWTEGKEDTTVTTDDVTFSVDTQAKKVTVTYSGFKDEIAYTVAAPAEPVVTDISVDKTSIEVPYAKSEKIVEYIKENINVKLVYDIADPEDAAKDDVKVELGDGKVTVSVTGYNFTKDVTYTIGEPVLVDIYSEKSEETTYEWNEAPTAEDAKKAYGKIYARYEFDNAAGYIDVDVTDKAEFSVSESDKSFYAGYADLLIHSAEYVILSAPKTLESDKYALTYSYGTEDLAAFVKGAVTLSVEREDGTAYEIKDGDIEITVNAEKTQATVKFLPKAINDVVISLTELDREVESIVALPESMTFAWDEEVTADSVKAKIESVVANYNDGKEPASEEVDGYTVTVNDGIATVSYGGAEDTIEIVVEAVPQTGIKADPASVEVPYGTKSEEIAKAIADAIKVYPVYADDSEGEAIVDFGVEIEGRQDTATITTGDFETTVSVTYATQEAKLVVPEKVSVPFNKHNEKSDAEIAEYIKDKLEGSVKYADAYGEESDVDDFTVAYDDGKATVTYEGLEAEIDVDLKKKSGSSTPSGTVVRPGSEPVKEAELKGIEVTADAVEIADADKADADKIAKAIKDAIVSVKAQWTEGKADTDVAVDDVTITVDTENNKATIEYNGFKDEIAYSVKSDDAPVSDLPYKDVEKDDWAYDAIKGLTDRGIINGDYGNTLRPDFGITREEVAKVVLKAKGIAVDESLELNVVDPESVSDWAVGYVATAMQEEIIKGYDDGTVKGNKIVTRAELAAIIVRTLNATSDVQSASFADVTEADWFFDEVECAKQLGIINGYEDGTFRGNNEVTRREAFAMVYRMVALIEALQQ